MRKNSPQFLGVRFGGRLGATATALLLSVGCAGPSQATAPKLQPASIAAPLHGSSEPSSPVSEAAPASTRRIGDFNVHMITGSFRKHPALFTERVTGKEGDAWIIEYRLEDTTGARGLRVWVDANGDVKRVVRLFESGEKSGTVADYEALMAMTSVVPDSNDGLTAATTGTCTVGPSELDCETKNYRVWLGDKEASMGVTASNALPGRDIAGEITAADGTLIYRSELLEQGNESESKDASVSLLLDE